MGTSKSFPLTSEVTYIGDDFNDKPRSVIVPAGYECTMYAANVGTGTTRMVQWSCPNLISMGLDLVVSNFKFTKIATRPVATVFQDKNYGGTSKRLYAGYKYRLYDASDLNDAISSIRVLPEYALKVWVDAMNNSNRDDNHGGQGRGESMVIDENTPNLGVLGMEDKISFIEVIPRPETSDVGDMAFSEWYVAELANHNKISCRYAVPGKGKIMLEIKSNTDCAIDITAKICGSTSPDDRNGWVRVSLKRGVVKTISIDESAHNCADGFWWWIRNFKHTGVSID
jgi:hypothetical protein